MPSAAGVRRWLLLLAAGTTLFVVGCSSPDAPGTPSPSTRPSVSVTRSWTPTPALQPPRTTGAPTPAPSTPTASAPIPGAYPGAGGPIPDSADPAEEQYEGVFVVRSPSGNIGCDLAPGSAGCGVLSILESGALGVDDAGSPLWWVSLDVDPATPAQVAAHPAPPLFSQPEAQLLVYGQVAYAGPYVCASEATGLTCWNSDTGRGVFLQRDSIQVF